MCFNTRILKKKTLNKLQICATYGIWSVVLGNGVWIILCMYILSVSILFSIICFIHLMFRRSFTFLVQKKTIDATHKKPLCMKNFTKLFLDSEALLFYSSGYMGCRIFVFQKLCLSRKSFWLKLSLYTTCMCVTPCEYMHS